LKELRTLVHMARVPPTKGQWSAFYAKLCCLIALYRESKSEAGRFVRQKLPKPMHPDTSFPSKQHNTTFEDIIHVQYNMRAKISRDFISHAPLDKDVEI